MTIKMEMVVKFLNLKQSASEQKKKLLLLSISNLFPLNYIKQSKICLSQ